MSSTSVLVVGGSLVGLSAAVFLGSRGVPTTLVERHPGSSPHPRAIGFTTRTLELFRSVGLGDRIPQVPAGRRVPRRVRAESLAGKWSDESAWTPGGADDRAMTSPLQHSPCSGAALAQDRLEPILRERARELGVELRLATELVRFDQDDDGVTATVRAEDGAESQIRAAYLIGADGTRSPVRDTLGIGRSGLGPIRTVRSVIFRAPLDEYLRAGIVQFQIEQPGFDVFLTTYGDGRWLLIFGDDQATDETSLRACIARAIGRIDVPVEIVATGRWEVSARVADRFSSGRVFLAGDAAHTFPPTRGGYGANTGIDDAHNLAWKLASVVEGTSSPELLDTYDVERRSIAWLRYGQIFARPDYAAFADESARSVPIYDDAAMELGQLYRSSAVLGAGDDLPPAAGPHVWAGQPGTRAPHVWIERDGERSSTLDLFARGWVLVADDDRWREAATHVHRTLGIAVDVVVLGLDARPVDGAPPLRSAFGLDAGGASLVRPDGYVVWRAPSAPADRSASLEQALRVVAAVP